MIENADVALIGGSETTASTMSNVFSYLLTNTDVPHFKYRPSLMGTGSLLSEY